jgi:hypothetical protein
MKQVASYRVSRRTEHPECQQEKRKNEQGRKHKVNTDRTEDQGESSSSVSGLNSFISFKNEVMETAEPFNLQRYGIGRPEIVQH